MTENNYNNQQGNPVSDAITYYGATLGAKIGVLSGVANELLAHQKTEALVAEVLTRLQILGYIKSVNMDDPMVAFATTGISLLMPVVILFSAGAAAGCGAYAVYGDKAWVTVLKTREAFCKTEVGLVVFRMRAALSDCLSPALLGGQGIIRALRYLPRLNERNFIDETGIEFRGATTPDFRRAMREAHAAIPEPVRNHMRDQEGVTAVGSSTAFEAHRGYVDDAATQKMIEDGWHNGIGGWYWHVRDQIIVNQHVLRSTRANAMDHALDAGGILTHLWEPQAADEVQRVYWHEFGHAVDDKFRVSFSPFFIARYQEDLAAMGGVDGGIIKGYSYYVNQPHPYRCHEEAFAEIFARQIRQRQTGDPDPMLADFPATAHWVGLFIADLERSCAIGPQEVAELKDYFMVVASSPHHAQGPITEQPQPRRLDL